MKPFSFTNKAFVGKFKSLPLLFLIALISPLASRAATFTVTNLNDTGAGSFRQAISSSNSTPGPDVIAFAVSGTINITTALPAFTDPVTINGTTAPGWVVCGPPTIAIDGGGGSGNGMQFLNGASGSSIIAINVRNFAFNGIQFINSDNCSIFACHVGTNLAGTLGAGNGQNGVQIEVGSDGLRIGSNNPCGRNIISGNSGFGISVNNCNRDTVVGNYIGLNTAGTAAIPNGSGGLLFVNGGVDHAIGGSLPGEGNVVSGNGTGATGNAINLDGVADCTVRGNYIGLNAAGTLAIGGAENGISLNNASNIIIGGTGATDGNVIADAGFHGIVLNNNSDNVVIQGNRIGTNAAGTASLGNADSGIIVINSSATIIGGNTAAHRNILSGSQTEYGIFLINADDAVIQGNYIGTAVDGLSPLSNSLGGINILNGTSPVTIGGSGAGEGNVIAQNSGPGVILVSSGDRQILISRNSMFCNAGKGIELNGVGNGNHPAPVFTSANTSGVTGTASANDVIELFYDSTCTAQCQGKDYIATVTANGSGNWSYSGPIVAGGTLVATARAVGPPPGNVNNTSEFSCFVILPVEGLSLSASPINNREVDVQWSTQTEINTQSFDLERSEDGMNFSKITTRNAAGNASEQQNYSFLDKTAKIGINYYRLKQIDLNGEFKYSGVVTATLMSAALDVRVFPQPGNQILNIEIISEKKEWLGMTLHDLQGRLIFEKRYTQNPGSQFQVPVANLADGIYALTAKTPSGTIAKLVSIKH